MHNELLQPQPSAQDQRQLGLPCREGFFSERSGIIKLGGFVIRSESLSGWSAVDAPGTLSGFVRGFIEFTNCLPESAREIPPTFSDDQNQKDRAN